MSSWYGGRDETSPLGTGREGGGLISRPGQVVPRLLLLPPSVLHDSRAAILAPPAARAPFVAEVARPARPVGSGGALN